LANDGSPDKSWEIIMSLSQEYPELRGICLTRNYGQDNAIMAGLNYARGKYVVIMDDDLQHSPYDISKLLEKCESGFDVCYADYSENKRQAFWKNLGSYLNSKQAELFIGKPQNIYLSPFKMISRVVVDSMLEYENSYPYIDGLIFRVTKSISQVPVEHHERYASVSNYNLRKSISVFLKHMTGFSIVPLRLASVMGFLITTLGLILAVYYIWSYFKGNAVEGWTTLVLLQLTLGGAILMSLGVIGEYIGRIYLVANKRPQFVVRKTTF
ncbi:MAG: glycosyltransferase family 2 protein, partial [Sulfuricurvum sp.]|nr:glycosyltransferase family 2 protein [Sulfuricurvum sp.]